MQPKKEIIGLPVYQPGKPIEEVKREYNLTEVIKLASNENPFGPSPKVQEAINNEFTQLAIYPDGASFELRHALAEHYGIQGEQLIFGNGSDEIVQMICRAFLTKDSQSVMATPTFPRYQANVQIEGAHAIEVPLKAGMHDLEQMKAEVTKDTKVVWLCSPNNPTGTYINERDLIQFLDGLSNEVLVVLDEAYYEYVEAQDFPNSIELLDKYPNLMILRTFSKVYGLASLRIGYGMASPTIMDHINRVREPFNTSRLAQSAATAALSDQKYVQYCFEKNRLGLEQFYEAFKTLNLFYYPSQGNFILVDVGRPSQQVFEELLKQGIIVRSGEALGFPTFLRITVGSEEQNQKIIDALRQVHGVS